MCWCSEMHRQAHMLCVAGGQTAALLCVYGTSWVPVGATGARLWCLVTLLLVDLHVAMLPAV
jgi:hypothetical protein